MFLTFSTAARVEVTGKAVTTGFTLAQLLRLANVPAV
jgi:hypothetical protein